MSLVTALFDRPYEFLFVFFSYYASILLFFCINSEIHSTDSEANNDIDQSFKYNSHAQFSSLK